MEAIKKVVSKKKVSKKKVTKPEPGKVVKTGKNKSTVVAATKPAADGLGQPIKIKGKTITPKAVKAGRETTEDFMKRHGYDKKLAGLRERKPARAPEPPAKPEPKPKKIEAPRDPDIHKLWERDEDAKTETYFAYFAELVSETPPQADVRGYVTFANLRLDMRAAKREADEEANRDGAFMYTFKNVEIKKRKVTLIVLD